MVAYTKMLINGQEEEEAGLEIIEDDSPAHNPHEEVPGDHHWTAEIMYCTLCEQTDTKSIIIEDGKFVCIYLNSNWKHL